jgi:hypothetical protein
MTIIALFVAALVFRRRVELHRPRDVASVVLGAVTGIAVSLASIESARSARYVILKVMSAATLPFLVCTELVFVGWASMRGLD